MKIPEIIGRILLYFPAILIIGDLAWIQFRTFDYLITINMGFSFIWICIATLINIVTWPKSIVDDKGRIIKKQSLDPSFPESPPKDDQGQEG